MGPLWSKEDRDELRRMIWERDCQTARFWQFVAVALVVVAVLVAVFVW